MGGTTVSAELAERPPRVAARVAAPVLLLRGPAGAGKTSLAEEVVAAWGLDVVRIRVRPDADAAAVADAAARSLRRSGRGDAAAAVAGAATGSAADVADRLVEVVAGLEEPLTVFLDDVQHLDDGAAAALADALVDLPAGDRLVVAGRELGALDQLRRRPDASAVGADDLRLGAADVAALLPGGTETLVAEVLAATDGWPAAVALAAGRLAHEPGWSPAASGGTASLLRELTDDLAARDPSLCVLARLPLIDDAVAAMVTEALALPHQRSVDVPTRTTGRWWSVADPFRAVLASTDPLPDPLVVQIAEHYRAWGEPTAGVSMLARECSPPALGAAVADLHWRELAGLEVVELRLLVERVLAEPGPGRTALLVAAARAVELSDRSLRQRWLEAALADGAVDPEAHRAALVERARDLLRSADVDGGAALAQEVLDTTGPGEPVTRARALLTIGIRDAFQCTAESLALAADRFREAASLFGAGGEHVWEAETLARLGYTALYFAGRPAEGEAAMAEALARLPVGDRVRAFWLTNYADVLDVLGRDIEADAAVRETMEIGHRRHDDTILGMAWWMRSWLEAHRGDAVATVAALDAVERHRGAWLQSGQDVEYLASSVEHLALVGDAVNARAYLERAEEAAAAIDLDAPVAVARATFDAMHGDPAAALAVLDGVEGTAYALASNRPRRLLVRAVALHRAGDAEAARATAAEAHSVAAAMGVPDLHERMHRRLLEVLAPADAPGDEQPATSLRLLGGFQLAVAGRDRTPPAGHPAQLVKLLAVAGPLAVEAAIDALWPEADAATGRSRLRNLLNRIKERSGPLIHRDADVLRLDPAVVVDAEEFDRAAASALTAPADQRVGRARQALALHAGTLLPGDLYEDWASAPRARLERRLVALADLVADDAVERGDLDEAARLLDIGIEAEPLDEARTLKLCDLLAGQGRRAAARSVARRCAVLLADLGVQASDELAAHLR